MPRSPRANRLGNNDSTYGFSQGVFVSTDAHFGSTLGDILGQALAEAAEPGVMMTNTEPEPKAKKERKAPEGLLFDIIYGNMSEPKAEWRVYDQALTLKAAQEFCKTQNARNDERAKAFRKGGDYHYESHSVNSYEYRSWKAELDRFDGNIDKLIEYNGYGRRYAMKKVSVERDFLAREAARTDNPVRIPDALLSKDWQGNLNYHYHCAEIIDGKMVSFHRSIGDAYDNKRTQMRLGRYLREFNEGLDDNMIADECAKIGITYNSDVVLKVARTREEIRHVYEHGPRSCMSGSDGWLKGVAPVEAYASDDICVYYLDRDGDITARVVCNMTNQRYARMYGDQIRLTAMIEKLGYKQSDYALGGAKLLKIIVNDDYRDNIMLPYLDGQCTEMLDMGDYLEIKKVTPAYTGSTVGYARYMSVAA
jgi:hypothetical protein